MNLMWLGGFKRCRWNPLLGSPLVAVKFDRAQLNLIDSEKKSLIHKEPILLDDSHYCRRTLTDSRDFIFSIC